MIDPMPEEYAHEMYADYCVECILEGVEPLGFFEWCRDEQIELV